MTTFFRLGTGMALCCLMAGGCSGKQQATQPADDQPKVAVTCVAVMPAEIGDEGREQVSPAEQKSLHDGALILDALLKQRLKGDPGVRFVSEGQARSVSGTERADSLSYARQVASRFSCNAVLEPTISRYHDRVGGQYGAKEPAAVTFSYQLYEVNDGQVLCHGRFDEKQQSVMENLLTIGKAKHRGLTWITAEQMLDEAVQDKLGQCQYIHLNSK